MKQCFTWGLTIRSTKGGSQWLRGFKDRVKLAFPLTNPDLGYGYIIWKVNTTNRGMNLKNTLCTICIWGWGFHVKPVFFFKALLIVTCSLMSWLKDSFTFTYLWTRLMEKWVKALHSKSEGPWLKPRLLVTLG